MTGTHERPIFLKPGHNAGDLVESTSWKILTEERGLVEVEAHLPEHLLNPRNQLFGGFTGTYVDMISILLIPTNVNCVIQKKIIMQKLFKLISKINGFKKDGIVLVEKIMT